MALVYSVAPHLAGNFLDLLLGIHDRLREYADVRCRHALVNQDRRGCNPLRRDRDAHGRQLVARRDGHAHPHLGAYPIGKSCRLPPRAQACSAQYDDFVRFRQRIFAHQPTARSAKRERTPRHTLPARDTMSSDSESCVRINFARIPVSPAVSRPRAGATRDFVETVAHQQAAQAQQHQARLAQANSPEHFPRFIAGTSPERLLRGIVEQVHQIAVIRLLKSVQRAAQQ